MERLRRRGAPLAALCAAGIAALASCEVGQAPPRRQVSDGDPDLGRAALARYGCGGCHLIPGVDRAAGRVAPPLDGFSQRAFVAGILSNTPQNLIEWIRHPREISPRTAMPNLGVTEEDARDMAAYLYSLDPR
ncbi:c-type cytochrome [Sorangium sp. So ce542]|uniref:c-type cytochrome n=1 Tax=Sorangium sp. So ce542 TaxID=3133316 RepID=UPI003F60DA8B